MREGDDADGRAVLVTLTDSGRELLARLQAAHTGIFAELLTEWTVADLKTLTQLLGRLKEDLVRLNELPDRSGE